MRKGTVELDFFPHGGFVFPDGLRDSGFCRSVGDAGKDDASFVETFSKSV